MFGAATSLCAPRIAELEEAGDYSARERHIWAERDQHVYTNGQKLGPATVYAIKETTAAVESAIKARIYNPETAADHHVARFEATGADVTRLGALITDCRRTLGSMVSAKKNTTLARKKPN